MYNFEMKRDIAVIFLRKETGKQDKNSYRST